MKLWSGSLIARLSWRLILLQLLALTLVVVVASIPEPDRRQVYELDDDVFAGIASHVVLEGDALAVRTDDALAAEMAREHPEFWFLAGDELGRTVAYGPVPDRALSTFEDVGSIIDAELYREGTAPDAAMIARRVDSAVGRLTIATGGGPTQDPVISRLLRIDPAYLLLLVGLMTGSALAIPVLLRRDLSGVARVAEEAADIDIDTPGTRLTEANVPPELQGLVGAMNAALSRLDEGIERRGRFLATAAHELRTPIAVLAMRVETLAPGPVRNQLLLDVARLSALADQLLDLQRLHGDHVRLGRIDLRTLAGQAVADIAPLAVASRAELSYDAAASAVEVMADAQAIARVITNLVQNALVHGGDGVVVAVEVRQPAELRVRDNGPGIAAADRALIFEPFFRRSRGGGSGLGLHLVREIVARHGGTIEAGDAPGGGTEFIVRLPPAGVAGG